MAERTYNINEMRPAIIKAREKGNRREISENFCKEVGVAPTYFKAYQDDVKQLYIATSKYCRLKNSPMPKHEELDAAFSTVRDLWQKFTECGEADELSKDLHISDHDVSNLVGFCQQFMNMKNNVAFEDGFVAEKAWAMNTMGRFQKYLETDLGIRIAKVEVLTDDQRDFLVAESKLLNQIKAATEAISEAEKQLARMTGLRQKAKSKEYQDFLDDAISGLTTAISDARKSIADAQTNLDALHGEELELDESDPDAQEETAAEEA